MTATVESDPESSLKSSKKTYLTFLIENVTYGISASAVSEIVKLSEIVHIPKMPNFVKGVINLREKLIPVIDLRARLEMPEREYDLRTCIIIINLGNHTQSKMGVIVDVISETKDILHSEINDCSNFDCLESNKVLEGIALSGNSVIMLLKIDEILKIDELKHYLEKIEK